MTRGDFRDKLARALDTSTTTPRPWSVAELDGIIKDAHETFVEFARPLERTVYIPLKSEAVWYRLGALADDIIWPLRIIGPHNNRRIIAVTLLWLDQHKWTWETTTGQTIYWTTAGYDWLGIFPKSAADGGLLRMDYAAWPQDALDDGTPLEVDEEDEDRLLEMAFADAQAWNWKPEIALEKLTEFGREVSLPAFRAQARLRHATDEGSGVSKRRI